MGTLKSMYTLSASNFFSRGENKQSREKKNAKKRKPFFSEKIFGGRFEEQKRTAAQRRLSPSAAAFELSTPGRPSLRPAGPL